LEAKVDMRRIEKKLWPYKVTVNSDWKVDITPIESWLHKQVGGIQDRWNVVYRFNHTDFYFKNLQDATLFALKWS